MTEARTDNVYYNPGDLGLTPVGEFDVYEPDYSFDMVVVWKDSEGKFYWAYDAGCSCPAPFENYHTLDDLETGTVHDFQKWVAMFNNRDYWADSFAALIERMRFGG